MGTDLEAFLKPTPTFDADHPSIRESALSLTAGAAGDLDKARRLFYFVRDQVRYKFWPEPLPPEEIFRASRTLEARTGFCIPKAILLASLARASGIPAGISFADIRNHRLSEVALEIMGTNVIRLHGYTVLFLRGEWVKATPAFDIQMCKEHRLPPVEFDGTSDAMLPGHDLDGKPYIDYVDGLVHRIYITELSRYYEDIEPEELGRALLEGFGGQYSLSN